MTLYSGYIYIDAQSVNFCVQSIKLLLFFISKKKKYKKFYYTLTFLIIFSSR